MTVATVMQVLRDKGMDALFSMSASASVAEAIETMVANEIGAVVVSTEDAIVGGIFTERDVMVRVVHAGLDPATTPLSLVMTRDVHYVSPGTTLEAALALMYVHRHRHLMVIDGPRVHGLIAMRDLSYQLIRRGKDRFEATVRLAGGPGT
jgi:CBS domain-containing protein